uniref:Uncharacterized protein n=1 Tax=Trichuris muris TaxID=70415 RepID=A0A5S6QS76_TRIMR
MEIKETFLVVERFWAFDISDPGTPVDPTVGGLWWTASDDGADEINRACRCKGMFVSYETNLRINANAKCAFCPQWMLRSSPHMRNWSAEWKIDERTLALTGKLVQKYEAISKVDGGGEPRWVSGAYTVSTGSHAWRVAGALQLYVATGAPIEFFDARRMALTAKGTATLIGAVWDAYVGSRGINASLAHRLFEAASPGDRILEELWAPTLDHINGWHINGAWWDRRKETAMPMILLRNDTRTRRQHIYPALAPHYEEKMVLQKFAHGSTVVA